jgi:hypothetical protein
MSWKAYSDGTPSVTYQYDPNIPNGKGRLASIFTSSASHMSDESISMRSGEEGFIARFKKSRNRLISLVNSAGESGNREK